MLILSHLKIKLFIHYVYNLCLTSNVWLTLFIFKCIKVGLENVKNQNIILTILYEVFFSNLILKNVILKRKFKLNEKIFKREVSWKV